MALLFRDPLVIRGGTGVIVNPNNTELFGATRQVVSIAIGQAVATTSNVVFGQITVSSNRFIIDNGQTTYSDGIVTGSLTLTDNLTVTQNFIGNGTLTVLGTLTAEKIETEATQSVTLFESGSTQFGDTSDDTHQFSGSIFVSGSLALSANQTVREISNDTSLADDSGVALVTENAVKSYLDDGTDDTNTYLRKCFTYTGSFVSTSTSSFTAITASAPSGITSTSEDDFMFFINGQMMEHDALTIQQSSSYFYLKIDNDSIGYDVASTDEIVAWGKFNS